MKKVLVLLSVIGSASAASADPAATILADQPFQSKPWANGDYYTITMELDGCMLTKTTVEYDVDDVAGDSHRIDIDLGQIDTNRLEISFGDVNLWGANGYEVTCTDISGGDCVIPNRPGESIKISESADDAAYADAVKEMIESCQ